MAKLMAYTDSRGVSYPESYWRLQGIDINLRGNPSATLSFDGYRDAAARKANLEVIGTQRYVVEGEAFATLFARHMKLEGNVAALSYEWLSARVDDPLAVAKDV